MTALYRTIAIFFLLMSSGMARADDTSKAHPLLQRLAYRVGDWEADLHVYGLKIGRLEQSWSWAAGGNLLVGRNRLVAPKLNIDSEGFSIVTVAGQELVEEGFSHERDGSGIPRKRHTATLNISDEDVRWKPALEYADVAIEQHDDSGITSLISMNGDSVIFQIVNWRRKTPTHSNIRNDAELDNYTVKMNIVYAEQPSGNLTLNAYVPNTAGPHAAVLTFHGGGGWRTEADEAESDAMAQVIAEKLGTTVFAINIRLAPKHKFPAQIEDCQQAVRWIRENATEFKVDPDRIAAYGYSAGGHLAALLGVQGVSIEGENSLFRLCGVVAGGAPCDLTALDANDDRLAYFLGGTRAEVPKAYESASPSSYVTKDASPIFFFHGDADEMVPMEHAQKVAKALTDVGVPSEFYIVPGGKHGVTGVDGLATTKACKFLEDCFAVTQTSE